MRRKETSNFQRNYKSEPEGNVEAGTSIVILAARNVRSSSDIFYNLE
jgi:hypothetical protein